MLWELAVLWGALFCLLCWSVPDRQVDTRTCLRGTAAGAVLCASAYPRVLDADGRPWAAATAAGALVCAGCAALWRHLRVARRQRADPLYRPEEAERAGEAGRGLLDQYDRDGDVAALNRGVDVLRTAVRQSAGHALHAVHAGNLVQALYSRYERLGDLDDLEEAVAIGRQAARAVAGDPCRPTLLSALCTALRLRHDHLGDLADLDEAVAAGQEAVDAVPERDPDRSHCLGELSVAHYSRFVRTDHRKDLAAAVLYREEALWAAAERAPAQPLHLVNLCHLLAEQARETGSLANLERAVAVGRQAVELTPAGHRWHASARTNLTLALRLRHARLPSAQDLDEGQRLCEEAMAGLPAGHPVRPRVLANLLMVLRARREALGTAPQSAPHSADLDRALLLGREAAASQEAGPSIQVAVGLAWGDLAASVGEYAQAVEAFEHVIDLLPHLAARDLRRTDQEYRLGRWNGVAAAAASCAVAAGRPDKAVLLLEKGRGVLLGRGLEARADLTRLRARHPGLARELAEVREALEGVTELRSRPGEPPGGPASSDGPRAPDPAAGATGRERLRASHRALLARWDALGERIRHEDGFADFGRAPDLDDLLAQSHQGPVVCLNVSRIASQAIALTGSGVRVVPLPAATAEDTVRHIMTFEDVLRSRHLREEGQRSIAEVLEWLWDAIAGPVLEALDLARPVPGGPWPRVWWVPTGILSFLPVHAAGYHGTRDDPEPRTVLDRVVSSYAPTVRALAAARARPPAPGPPRPLAVAVPGEPGTATALRHARAETDLVGRLFPGSRTLIGEQATRERVLAELPRRSWVHFACHGVTDLDEPSHSKLLLYGHDRGAHADVLSVEDISRLDLSGAELAYLSACDTAHPSLRLPDEAIHLASAFQLAGFPQVLAALWPSHDRVASGFVEEVYRRLASTPPGDNRPDGASAAHHATRAARRAYPNFPGLWAGYVHVGV
ncbi:CHAT domain-containing protein [Streptomyces sp. NPDC086549]|uniref:CHAT domain-containing protein n=1 Tax=Streptomyces sp. NPDC086549 TaxID=3365752 RepID=UPI0038027F48